MGNVGQEGCGDKLDVEDVVWRMIMLSEAGLSVHSLGYFVGMHIR